MSLLRFTNKGIYCPQAKVYIDPWKPVNKAIITHAHADHSRWGMKNYLAHNLSVPVMKYRLGSDINVEGVDFNEPRTINGVKFSLHPAGHIYGSAQVRVEYKGEVWVVSGDYKTENDKCCTPFEPVKCHSFITESTFGLPVYRWENQESVFEDINSWWRKNKEQGKTTILCGYSLGKAQRIIQNLDSSIGKIYTHGAVENTNEVLREAGIVIQETTQITQETPKKATLGNIVIAPPSALGTPWARKLKPYSTGVASGWMMVRGMRRRRNADRGFVLSDHADWQGLNESVKATGAENIYVTHGYSTIFANWLKEQGYNASVVDTEYEGENMDEKEEKGDEE
ncbi:ligase-associated DNA damage response exonuclease [Halocola ammonii]